MVCGRKWLLVDLNAEKTQLVSFDCSKNTGAIVVKMDGSVLQEKLSLKMLRLSFSSTLDCDLYIISVVAASKKIGVLICSVKFLSPEMLLGMSINLPYGLTWNTVVMSGLMLQAATWNL